MRFFEQEMAPMTSCACCVSCNMECGRAVFRPYCSGRRRSRRRGRTGGWSENTTPHTARSWVTQDPGLMNDLDDSLINVAMLCPTVWAMCVPLTLTHANYTPDTKPLWNRWVLCNLCKHITSVHDTAKGFGGVGLRKGKADIAERIWDTLHRPDDTWSTGKRDQWVRLIPAVTM